MTRSFAIHPTVVSSGLAAAPYVIVRPSEDTADFYPYALLCHVNETRDPIAIVRVLIDTEQLVAASGAVTDDDNEDSTQSAQSPLAHLIISKAVKELVERHPSKKETKYVFLRSLLADVVDTPAAAAYANLPVLRRLTLKVCVHVNPGVDALAWRAFQRCGTTTAAQYHYPSGLCALQTVFGVVGLGGERDAGRHLPAPSVCFKTILHGMCIMLTSGVSLLPVHVLLSAPYERERICFEVVRVDDGATNSVFRIDASETVIEIVPPTPITTTTGTMESSTTTTTTSVASDALRALSLLAPKRFRGLYFSGSSGSGKSFTAGIVSSRCFNDNQPPSGPVWRHTLKCSSLLGDSINDTAHNVACLVNTAKMLRPAVVILEDADVLTARDTQKLPTCRLVVHAISQDLFSLDDVVALVTVSEKLRLPKLWLSPSRLATGFTMYPPTYEERKHIIAHHHSTTPNWTNSPTLVAKVAQLTNSWLPCELACLAQEREEEESAVLQKLKAHTPHLIAQSPSVRVLHASDPLFGDSSAPRGSVYVPLGTVWSRVEDSIVFPMANLDLLRSHGLDLPKGVLLHGPSGSGKSCTLKEIARVLLKDPNTNCNVIFVDATSLVSKFVGESEKNLRELFVAARSASPCLLLVDHVERLAAHRANASSSTDERLLSTFLTEIDGIASSVTKHPLMVVGTTEKCSELDPAALRAGRFDVHIELQLPTISEKQTMLKGFLQGTEDHGVTERTLLKVGWSPDTATAADVENAYLSAAWAAARRGSASLCDDDFNN